MNAFNIVSLIGVFVYFAWLALLVFGPIIMLLKRLADVDSGKEKLFWLYAGLFFSGILCVPLAIVVEKGMTTLLISSSEPTFWTSFATAFGVAAIPEESLKFAFLLSFVFWSGRLTKYVRGLTFAAFVSLGFAVIENLFYVFSTKTAEGMLLMAAVRAFTSIPGHFAFSLYMGYFASLAFLGSRNGENLFKTRGRFADWSVEERRYFVKNLALAWAVAVGVHGGYDFFLLFAGTQSPLRGVSVVAFIFFFVAAYWFGKVLVDQLKEKDAAVLAKTARKKNGDVYRIATRR